MILRYLSLIIILFFTLSAFGQEYVGTATVYSKKYSGRPTYSGQKYNPKKVSAAHPWLPMGTRVKVTNLSNKKSTIVVINDRMAKHTGFIIDLSTAAALKISAKTRGLTRVSLRVMKE